ncbi:TPA: hypothetical protein TUU01_000858 [Streptococcus equi subsp. zooepidemicus]|uniref:hypothetical protein n=1 Tax=Streptococcus equi TaxID=1336 RepID=UPI001E4D1E26|nr:hypothetical protein [Streptococcus equi]MCD3367561.1 hypothetical protein [Streptococcus equi subsp. zooepidemicus]MDI6044188.1 hypothetical protein [Streptococcus equi subsp. zooepidemicus]WOK57441.1 hypothetical protein RIM63_01345 [Streptococcus equi subsp. zooepidemicus]HEK9098031.1 hypothetical protein [Streptococcus equi subsp. zooepidemicus]HEL0025006.1 hypothetical protein [Streptococcus equi subsp. zooepidemicus]
MARSQLEWEDVSQYEEVKGYGQRVWKHQGEYYLVREEGGIATQRVVYKLPNELFQLLESGRKSLLEIDFYVKNGCWPPNISQEEADRLFLRDNPELLENDVDNQKLFTRRELEELLPEGSLILASSDSD